MFIDTHYDQLSQITDVAKEKFNEYTEELWEFAENQEPFPMKDIEVALGELATLYQKLRG